MSIVPNMMKEIETYAEKVNSQYSEDQSFWLSLKERLKDRLSERVRFALESAIEEFKNRNPNISKFSDLSLCQAAITTLDKLVIDTTIQRPLNIRWVMYLIYSFRQSAVMAIQVYEHPDRPGYYVVWDGQHTAILLYILIKMVFGEKLEDCKIPITISSIKDRHEIRENFIELNGDGKKALDEIDLYQQKVRGVRVDNSENPDWVETEEKQQKLENHGLFVTHEKFSDTKEIGAISRLNEIKKYNVASVSQFAKYWSAINQERSVEPKELVMIFWYFDTCRKDGIKVDDDYIVQFATKCKELFEADFDPDGDFFLAMGIAYKEWHKGYYQYYRDQGMTEYIPVPRPRSEPIHGGPYLIGLLRKNNFKLKIPLHGMNTDFDY